jgi:uncharacterized protein YggT (Ycf19 family)
MLRFGDMTTSFPGPGSTSTRRQEAITTLARVIDYLFGLLYTLLAVRLLLDLVGARRGAGFGELIASLTAPFYAPFKGIVASQTIDGSPPIGWSIVVAILAYMLLHGAIRGLLHLLSGE